MTLILKRPAGAGLIFKRPVGARLELTPTNLLPDDPDAIAYITAVEAADGQALEPATRLAINAFVKGCKVDGTWPALKACCIMAGARTLAGALVPLVGPAPTNFNFVAGDYDRKTGLKGDGISKYLNSNRSNNADPQNSKHISCFVTQAQTNAAVFMGTLSLNSPGDCYMYTAEPPPITTARLNSSGFLLYFEINQGTGPGLAALSRFEASYFVGRFNNFNYVATVNNSHPPINEDIHVFRGGNQFGNLRLSYYSIGESLNLALLDARVSALMAALAVAIP